MSVAFAYLITGLSAVIRAFRRPAIQNPVDGVGGVVALANWNGTAQMPTCVQTVGVIDNIRFCVVHARAYKVASFLLAKFVTILPVADEPLETTRGRFAHLALVLWTYSVIDADMVVIVS